MTDDTPVRRYRGWSTSSVLGTLSFVWIVTAVTLWLAGFLERASPPDRRPDLPPAEIGMYDGRIVVQAPALELRLPDGWTEIPTPPSSTVTVRRSPATLTVRVLAPQEAGPDDEYRTMLDALQSRADVTILDRGASTLSFYAADAVTFTFRDERDVAGFAKHWFRIDGGYRLHVACVSRPAEAKAALAMCEAALDRLSRR